MLSGKNYRGPYKTIFYSTCSKKQTKIKRTHPKVVQDPTNISTAGSISWAIPFFLFSNFRCNFVCKIMFHAQVTSNLMSNSLWKFTCQNFISLIGNTLTVVWLKTDYSKILCNFCRMYVIFKIQNSAN